MEIDTDLTVGEITDIFAKSLVFLLKDGQGICVIYDEKKIIIYRSSEEIRFLMPNARDIEMMKEGETVTIGEM